jgi:hypothetical protein
MLHEKSDEKMEALVHSVIGAEVHRDIAGKAVD